MPISIKQRIEETLRGWLTAFMSWKRGELLKAGLMRNWFSLAAPMLTYLKPKLGITGDGEKSYKPPKSPCCVTKNELCPIG